MQHVQLLIFLGDELDGPRGRIYLIKEMIENKKTPTKKVVSHIDKCLSCYSCMTTCPSGVNYMHLIDHGRNYVEKKYKRPFLKEYLEIFYLKHYQNQKFLNF